jgi:2-polyprenyl-6-methoxyphenol hydroxylase-like FAD-dependent oxidoreductase
MSHSEIPVLVVGAGPVGLAMACDLARHGVACRIIDEAEGPTDQSRALAIWERTLEVLDDLGVIGPVLAQGKRMHGMNAYAGGHRLLHVGLDLEGEVTPYPLAISLPQGQTQRILIDRLRALGVEVEWRTKLGAPRADQTGVTATVVSADGGERTFRADWLIGCDGARSAVRKGLGIAFEGEEYEETFLLADVHVAWSVPDDEGHLLLLPEGGAVVALPLPEPGRWRLIDASGVVDADDPGVILARFQDVLRTQGHPGAVVSDPVWTSAFRIHRRVARAFRVGRCFLAGDAAHIHSPAGGQGMNTGIQDAHNLAWKLGLVVRGLSPESLLDSYEAERRPVAQAVARGTDVMTRFVTLRHPASEAIRNTLLRFLSHFDFVRHRAVRTLSEIDVNYRKSPIVAEHWPTGLGALLADGANLGRLLTPGHAPRPGDRVPDVTWTDEAGTSRRLFEILRGTGHVLLAFAPASWGERSLREVAELDRQLRSGLAPDCAGYLVSGPASTGEPPAWGGGRLIDREGRLRHAFDAEEACLYLVRPDGHLGYRQVGLDAGPLAEYLKGLFNPVAPDEA